MGRVGIFHRAACLCMAALIGAPAIGAEGAGLLDPFDAAALSVQERRIVQSALAVQGLYAGLADGGWTDGADAAMARYAAKRFASPPLNAHMATLTLDFAKARADAGWEMVWRPRERAAFAAPTAIVTRTDRGGMQVWAAEADDLMIILGQGGPGSARKMHRLVEGKAAGPDALFQLARDGAMLTSAIGAGDRSYYARSARMDGIWTTVTLIADPARKNEMNAIAASLSFGAPAPWSLPEGGVLSVLLAETVAAWETAKTPRDALPGAGFYVSGTGEVLTHAQNVAGCAAMQSGGRVYRVAAVDGAQDLALLRPDAPFAPPAVAAFAAGPGGGGQGAPGAPTFDAHGLVTGVAVPALDAIKMASAAGGGPETHAAIPGGAAKRFLSTQGVDFRVGIPGGAMPPAQLTIPLTCN